jgi:hypothetical protein
VSAGFGILAVVASSSETYTDSGVQVEFPFMAGEAGFKILILQASIFHSIWQQPENRKNPR